MTSSQKNKQAPCKARTGEQRDIYKQEVKLQCKFPEQSCQSRFRSKADRLYKSQKQESRQFFSQKQYGKTQIPKARRELTPSDKKQQYKP